MQTMVRTEVAIDGKSFFLAQGQAPSDLQRQIVDALGAPGEFVTFTVVGNREVSVLITPRSQVVFTVETVQFDPRDTGDSDSPYGGHYDYWTVTERVSAASRRLGALKGAGSECCRASTSL